MTWATSSFARPANKKRLITRTIPFAHFVQNVVSLIDLGEWADEGHRIPGQPVPPESTIQKSILTENPTAIPKTGTFGKL